MRPQVAIRIVETIGLTEIKELPISAMDDTIYRNNFSPDTRAAYQVWRSSIIKDPLSPEEIKELRKNYE